MQISPLSQRPNLYLCPLISHPKHHPFHMAVVHPFAAWRPSAETLNEVACVPYDVINTAEARALSEGKANSFLHVIRPEIDFPEGVNIYSDEVYAKGRDNLKAMMDNGFLQQDSEPMVYIYRLTAGSRTQTGLFTCVSVADYDNEVILKHELTRPDKEDDRTKHITTQSAHAEPVMMTYRGTKEINALTNTITVSTQPIFDFTAEDGVRHTIWATGHTAQFVEAFAKVDHFYIADGHHRCKSASRTVADIKQDGDTGNEEYNFFPAVLFPMEEMAILAYNRIVYKLPDNFEATLKESFEVTENASPVPQDKGSISLYLNGQWLGVKLPESDNNDPVRRMDVSRLHEFLLQPLLGIKDQRTDKNLFFVGGIRGTGELEKLVDAGKAELGISMYPTDITQLVDVSDAGLLMPPKSTWFEPKVRSGLLVHAF